jgi:hypothetical protein
MGQVEQHWQFAILCILTALFMVRLVLAERITLQSSLSFLVLLSIGTLMAIFPNFLSRVAVELGFALPSNFYFAFSLLALAALHVHSLIMNSRVAMRSVALTQELAILQERIDRLQRELERQESASCAQP